MALSGPVSLNEKTKRRKRAKTPKVSEFGAECSGNKKLENFPSIGRFPSLPLSQAFQTRLNSGFYVRSTPYLPDPVIGSDTWVDIVARLTRSNALSPSAVLTKTPQRSCESSNQSAVAVTANHCDDAGISLSNAGIHLIWLQGILDTLLWNPTIRHSALDGDSNQ
ncbi:hypothetical protein PCH_Pc12g05860 [Penicillium rubens Wisconsin 54-1255]|uniref:Uncharacterized protein n=1 Tax=Penicillium rubens (strain ATCC 28089 / DSM 1075 / NRRL 1951 / Wisconsin 54-1255) TaxID=500485 RepID=B6GZQ1_PENRW|nr:hypothetical protein PCH_Pc12g05860 [Penicillium rubens Wisconsin 54-1255]